MKNKDIKYWKTIDQIIDFHNRTLNSSFSTSINYWVFLRYPLKDIIIRAIDTQNRIEISEKMFDSLDEEGKLLVINNLDLFIKEKK